MDAKIIRHLEAWSDGSLTAADAEDLAAALANPALRAEARGDRLVDLLLRLDATPAAGAAAAEMVLAALAVPGRSAHRPRQKRPLRRRARPRWPIVLAAAVLAMAAGLALLMRAPPPVIITPGQHRLPSGDVVDVVRGTLRIDSAHRWRLDDGTVSIAAATRPAQEPLRILTPDARLTVVGTRFTVESAPGATTVAVSEGAVVCEAGNEERRVGARGRWHVAEGRTLQEQDTAVISYRFAGEDLENFNGDPVPLDGPDGVRCIPGVQVNAEYDVWGVYLAGFGTQLAFLAGGERIQFRLWLAADAPAPEVRIDSAGERQMYGLTIDPPRERWVDIDVPLSDLLPQRGASGKPTSGSRLQEMCLITPDGAHPRMYVADWELVRRRAVP